MLYFLLPHPSTVFNLSNYIITLLAITSITGDYIVSRTKLHLFQALFDNFTHASIGALSWLYVCINCKNRTLQSLAEIALCATVASFIDLDHFFAAKSLYLKDAVSLHKRPPLHSSTFPFLCSTLFLLFGHYLQVEFLRKFGLIMLTAFTSHHLRDATRRGFWFHPFGSTPPIPYFVYVGSTCIFPHFVYLLSKATNIEGYKSKVPVIHI